MAWLYAYHHPEYVRSLTLLSVGGFPAVDWQAHYYMLRQLMPCRRELVLQHMVDILFGKQCKTKVKHMVRILDQDLTLSLSPHSLLQVCKLPAVEAIPTSLFVSSAQDDYVVDQLQIETWKSALKKGDYLWTCPQGRHFFHYFFPQLVGEQISRFWQNDFQHSTTCAQTQKLVNRHPQA
jgi:pimeloyl-ACP methyl ester carboxylesterase